MLKQSRPKSPRERAAPSPDAHLRQALACFTPPIAALGRAALARLRKQLPTATRGIHDAYNFLGVGFGASPSASDTIVSIVIYPQRVRLFFLQAGRSQLDDPEGLLEGKGAMVRSIILDSAAAVDRAPVRRLIAQAVQRARQPPPARGRGGLLLKSIARTRRPRRP